jgi:hypothetical protein
LDVVLLLCLLAILSTNLNWVVSGKSLTNEAEQVGRELGLRIRKSRPVDPAGFLARVFEVATDVVAATPRPDDDAESLPTSASFTLRGSEFGVRGSEFLPSAFCILLERLERRKLVELT